MPIEHTECDNAGWSSAKPSLLVSYIRKENWQTNCMWLLYTGEYAEDLADSKWLSLMKITSADSKTKKRNLDTHATCVVSSCLVRLLEFYSFINMLWHRRRYKLFGLNVETIFNLTKLNSIPCICTITLSLGQRVDDWLHS